jgi:tetratricopeptide (TPR) repeat protein
LAKPPVLGQALGEIDRARGNRDFEAARRAAAEALQHFPDNPELIHRAALVEHATGRHAAARALLEPALGRPAAPHKLFALAIQVGRALRDLGWAERVARLALERWPSLPEFHLQLGTLLTARNQAQAAAWHLEAAVNLHPYHGPAQFALALALERLDDHARAEHLYRNVIASDARASQAMINLGVILQKQERLDEALTFYRRAAELPHPAVLHSNLGALYRSLGRFDEARAAYGMALGREPNSVSYLYNYGNLLKEIGDLDGSIAAYRRGLAIEPENASVHWNLSLALLAAGRLKEGFNEYEWRWQYKGFPSKRRDFKQPMWNGRPCPGRTLLIHTEQGMGDVLQFMRFLPLIVTRAGGARVVFECHKPLMRLFEGLTGLAQMVERLGPEPLPHFDLHLPLMSAAHVLGIDTLDELPRDVPFIPMPDPAWFPVPEARADRLKVGLVWAGNPQFSGDRMRSTRLETVLPLIDVAGTQVFSLQKGEPEAQLKDAPPALIRLNERIGDFRDTAAAMLQLDLVITTCTSVAHLAGALGRPVWVMLSHAPDWRWLLGRDDCPWYPSARLFRQRGPADWSGVVGEVRAALAQAAEARARGAPAP